jgi:hypothetical protein
MPLTTTTLSFQRRETVSLELPYVGLSLENSPTSPRDLLSPLRLLPSPDLRLQSTAIKPKAFQLDLLLQSTVTPHQEAPSTTEEECQSRLNPSRLLLQLFSQESTDRAFYSKMMEVLLTQLSSDRPR